MNPPSHRSASSSQVENANVVPSTAVIVHPRPPIVIWLWRRSRLWRDSTKRPTNSAVAGLRDPHHQVLDVPACWSPPTSSRPAQNARSITSPSSFQVKGRQRPGSCHRRSDQPVMNGKQPFLKPIKVRHAGSNRREGTCLPVEGEPDPSRSCRAHRAARYSRHLHPGSRRAVASLALDHQWQPTPGDRLGLSQVEVKSRRCGDRTVSTRTNRDLQECRQLWQQHDLSTPQR